MTLRPSPARIVRRRRQWALPFARAFGRPAAVEDADREANLPAAPLNRDEDFLRRLREAGL
jgi:hypothetical protein